MGLSRADLDAAVAEGILDAAQAERLLAFAERRAPSPASPPPGAPRARFDLLHVAWYFGALIVIGAMGWFMTLGWERFGGAGIFSIAALYGLLFLLLGLRLWRSADLRTPGGLLVTMAVAMTPLATYGLQRWLDLWPDRDPGDYAGFHVWVAGGWFAMEVATLVAGTLALRAVRFPFLTVTIAFTLWYVSMDLAPLLGADGWNERAWVSAGVGLAMLVAAWRVDRRTREDFAFWLYLFGLLAFWGGLSSMQSGSELKKLLYLLVNLALILVSVLLRRRAFLVFGALGVCGYLGYLAHHVFRDSLLFPFALSGLGLGIIALGVHLHRSSTRYEAWLVGALPPGLRARLPSARPPP